MPSVPDAAGAAAPARLVGVVVRREVLATAAAAGVHDGLLVSRLGVGARAMLRGRA